ncbi:MAG: SAVED domain-containing protein [Hyphomicrobium sp.]|nr:SAVED domain-containing protein [Hyphomicrobium sp.]
MNASVSPIPDDTADDATSVIDVTRRIKPAVQMALVARAAGRCQFRGCNEFLFEHPLTRADGNFSEKAHIVAFKKRGPRGMDGDRPEDINALSNLMLLCLRDHKLVDDNPAKYPRGELEEQKAEHETRMARLTALAPQMRSTVLTIKARIGSSLVEVGEHEVWQALYPRYPSERRPHVLDLTELGDEKAGAFYALAQERIHQLAGELYATGSDLRATGHLSVLGLAPMPLLALLGSCLSNKVAVDFFQCHRTRPDRFTWYEEGDVVRFLTRKLRDGTAPGKSVLLLSLSGQLGLGDVPSSIDTGSAVYEITLDSMPPDLGFLRRREDLEAFRVIYRALLASLRAESLGRTELHLLPAAPAPVALACGYDLLPKVDPDLVLYDNIKPHGFIERLKVRNHDRI